MAKKTLQLAVEFDDLEFNFNKKSSERQELIGICNEEIPSVRVWTSEEVFLGKEREINYVDGISFVLTRIDGYKFSNSRLENSSFYYDYSHFDESSFLSFKEAKKGFRISGKVVVIIKVDSKDLVDFKDSGLLHFDSMSFGIKGTGDKLDVKKYGEDWETERNDCTSYRKGESNIYIEGLPKLNITE